MSFFLLNLAYAGKSGNHSMESLIQSEIKLYGCKDKANELFFSFSRTNGIGTNDWFKKQQHSRDLLLLLCLDLFVGVIIVTRDIIEKSCIPFGLGSIGCRLTSFIQVLRFKKAYWQKGEQLLMRKLEIDFLILICLFFSREQFRTIQGSWRFDLSRKRWDWFSYVLVCVSIDRLYAIIRPMDVRTASSSKSFIIISIELIDRVLFSSLSLLGWSSVNYREFSLPRLMRSFLLQRHGWYQWPLLLPNSI